MVEIQIVSDLHPENPSAYDVFGVTLHAPFLAPLGDIGVMEDAGFFTFIETQQIQVVFLLQGNHDPWQSSWLKTRLKIFEFSDSVKKRWPSDEHTTKPLGEFIFLDRTR